MRRLSFRRAGSWLEVGSMDEGQQKRKMGDKSSNGVVQEGCSSNLEYPRSNTSREKLVAGRWDGMVCITAAYGTLGFAQSPHHPHQILVVTRARRAAFGGISVITTWRYITTL